MAGYRLHLYLGWLPGLQLRDVGLNLRASAPETHVGNGDDSS